jgi:hypothetical protein
MLKRAALAALVLLGSHIMPGQEFRGTILGRVSDPSGAIVAGALVQVVSDETRVRVEARTNQEGNYNVPFLLPGQYTVTVTADGFRPIVRQGITVQVNDRVELDFMLEIGATTEAITVSEQSPLLQTASPDLGQVVDRHLLDRLPLSGRNAVNLIDLAPGVMGGGGDYTSNAQNDITINGGSGGERGNEMTVDGIPNVNPRQNGLFVTVPAADAVQEFKVNTTMFDAANGRSNAGSLSFSTRAGTNQFHGSVHDFYRNRALNANSWANNRSGLPKPPVSYNQWGGTVGGPVRLPKYDGRNKTFFFFYFEKTTNKQPDTRYARVPTELERQGDFSQTLAPAGAPVQIYDPFSTVVNGSTVTRTAFAGARIPAARINPVGAAVLAQYPMSNLAVPARIGLLNWAGTNTFTIDTQNFGIRIDQAIGTRHRLYSRFSALNRDQEPTPDFFPGNYDIPFSTSERGTSNIGIDSRRNKSFALDDSILITPSFFGSLRYGYARTWLAAYFNGSNLDPKTLRLPEQILANQATPGWPIFNLGENMAYIGSRSRQSVNDTHALLATFNKLRGSHTLKFGVDYRLIRWNEANPGTSGSGNFSFNSTFTRSDPGRSSTSDTSGTSMASLLLGVPSSGSLGYVSSLSLQSHYAGLFVQDDIKLTPKFMLNLGLRYELETPFTERFDRISYGFDESAKVPVEVPGMDLRGGLLFVNQDGRDRRQGILDTNNFGPRVGFAYSVNPTLVLRGGYGMFFSSGIVNQSALVGVASFDAITRYVASTDGNRTPFTTISNPFPNGIVQPTGSSLGLATELGNSITYLDSNRILPYVQQWQFSVQRELPWSSVIEAAYVGVQSLKLPEDFNLNEKPDQFLALGTAENDSVPNPFFGRFPPTSTLGSGANTTRNRFWVRFPQFNAVNVVGMNTARSNYHALQLRFQKRLSRGLALVANYTNSKTMEYNAASVVNERHYRSVSDIDRPQIFRLFATYELPFGRGRALGRNWAPWFDYVLGGWEVSGFWKLTSGEALSVTERRGRPLPIRDIDPSGSVRNRLGDRIEPATGLPQNPYFDTTAFVRLPSDYSITPEPLRLDWLRGPRQRSTNLTLFKIFRFTEQLRMELRGELNNPTNTPAFENPGTDMSNPATFGVINEDQGARSVQLGLRIHF